MEPNPLGTFILSPQLDGSVFVYHTDKELSRRYPGVENFLMVMKRKDYGKTQLSVATILAEANRGANLGYYKNNGQVLSITRRWADQFRESFMLSAPADMAVLIEDMRDTAPLMANTKNPSTNRLILESVAVLSCYYDKYLTSFAGFSDTYLSK